MVLLGFPVPEGMLFAVAMGYGLMMVWDVVLLYRYFPQSDESPWTFLKWVDEFLPLAFTGLCTNIGLFAHLVICWVGPVGVQVKGLFYGAPYYDVPALIAFLTILITSINFVVSVEVNFYPKYRDYYSLFNDGGVVGDIVTAEEEMLAVLNRELRFTALKQLFVTAAVLSLEGTLLDLLPLGFNDLMHGYFRTLCVGYGLYAVGNTILMILLYFTDYRGAVTAAAVFAVSAVHGVQHRVLRLRLPHRGCAVLSGHAAPAGRLYGQPAVSGPGPAAHRGRDQGRAVYPAGPVSGNQIGSACKTRRRRGEGR